MWNWDITTLQNGLRVLRVPMKSSSSVTVLALCNTGSRYESETKQGIAHFFEHMVFKGSAKYPTAHDLATTVDSIGAHWNAFTSKEYTGYYVQAASRHLSIALDVVSDMLLQPQLRQDDIDREKGVIIEEINMYVDSPTAHVANQFEQQIFGTSGLGHDIIGTKETVSSFKTADFETFLKEWYGLQNMVLVVAGDAHVLEGKSLIDHITTAFSKAGGDRAGLVSTLPLCTTTTFTQEKVKLIHRPTEQTHFVLGMPGFSRHDDRRFALTVLDNLLGGNMSSRLFSEIREKRGLCYYVHSDSDHYHDLGVFGAAAGVDPKRAAEALEATLQELKSVSDGTKPITEQELQRTKEYIAGKMQLGLESSNSVANYFGMKALLTETVETPDEIIAKLQAVNVQEVQELATALWKQKAISLTILGPHKNAQEFETILQSSMN